MSVCVCERERERERVCVEEKISENTKGGGGVIEKERFFSDRRRFRVRSTFELSYIFLSEKPVARKYRMK